MHVEMKIHELVVMPNDQLDYIQKPIFQKTTHYFFIYINQINLLKNAYKLINANMCIFGFFSLAAVIGIAISARDTSTVELYSE